MQAAFYAIVKYSPICEECLEAGKYGLNPYLYIINTRQTISTLWNGIGS